MVAFLDKPTESDGFEQIMDFVNAHPIKYALTVNPTIYTSCIEQFWTIAKVKAVNGEVQIQALVDKKKVIITETSVRSDLQLEDAEGTECLPNATIFEQLTLMGQEILLVGDTPLFPTMIVQAQEQEGEGSVMPTVPQHTPTINQPSSSQPQKKKNPRKSKKQNTEVSQPSDPTKPTADETENMESVPTHSNDPRLNKDQILIDEEITQRLQEELQAELEEEERLARQKEEDANIAE
ncbi:hypothetical protein Tco_0744805 [Tanacetum coccineum]